MSPSGGWVRGAMSLCGELNPAANPLVVRELRSRMRGPRVFWLLLMFQALLCGTLITAWGMTHGFRATRGDALTMHTYGHQVFLAIMIAEAVMVSLVVPALAAGAFTLEREKQTLDMLVMTRLSGLSASLGKALGASMVGVLLLLTSVPPCLACLFMGGVSPGEIASCFLGLAIHVVFLSILVTSISAGARSTAGAVFAAEMLALLFLTAGGLEQVSSTPTLASGLTPLSWVVRTLRPEGLGAPFFATSLAFIVPAMVFLLAAALFLSIQGPARIFPPRPAHRAVKRIAGLVAYLGLYAVVIGGFLRSMVVSGVGSQVISIGHSSGNDLRAVFAYTSIISAVLACLYANVVAIDDGFRPEMSTARGMLRGFRLRTLLFGAGPECAFAIATIIWLLGPLCVVVGAVAVNEDVSQIGLLFALALLVIEGVVVLTGHAISVAIGLRLLHDLTAARVKATAILVGYLLYPSVIWAAYGIASTGMRRLADDPAVWLSAANPLVLGYLFSTAHSPNMLGYAVWVGGVEVGPWTVGLLAMGLFCLLMAARGAQERAKLAQRLAEAPVVVASGAQAGAD